MWCSDAAVGVPLRGWLVFGAEPAGSVRDGRNVQGKHLGVCNMGYRICPIFLFFVFVFACISTQITTFSISDYLRPRGFSFMAFI